MNEMNTLTLNGQQYEVADKVARQAVEGKAEKSFVEQELAKKASKQELANGLSGKADTFNLDEKLDKEPIPMATTGDTQAVRRKPDGSLWTKPTGGGGGTGGSVDSVNGQTGDVILKLGDLNGDAEHRTVTDTQISDWNNKQPSGDYATADELTSKLDKATIGEATPEDTQEVHLTPEGKLMTIPGSGGSRVALTAVITLVPDGWAESSQKVANEIFKSGEQYVYTVSPFPDDVKFYSDARILATAVDDSGMTFSCVEKPTKAIRVNVSMVEAKK